MSINLTDLFTQLGRVVAWCNTLTNYQNSIYLAANTGLADNLQTAFDTNRSPVNGFQSQVQGFASAMAGQVSQVQQIATPTLAQLQGALNAPSSNPQVILPLLAGYMVANSQTIQSTVPAAPTITPNGGNIGNDVLVISNLNEYGVVDETSINETVSLVCTSSQYSGGTAGAEQFSIVGQPTLSASTYGVHGNGNSSIRVTDSQNLVVNGNFETWSVANTPDGWTTTGTIGVNILENTANPHSGTAALEMDGDGSTPTIGVSQVIAPLMRSQTVYVCSVWLRISGTVSSGSTLAVDLTGTGFSTQTIASIDPSTLTTSYQQYTLFFAMPTNAGGGVPADLTVNISWTSANSAGASAVILVDDLVVATPVNFGGMQYALFRGSVDPVVGDQYTVVTSLTSAGVFQSWFALWFGEVGQLPSSATPTISDSLAM